MKRIVLTLALAGLAAALTACCQSPQAATPAPAVRPEPAEEAPAPAPVDYRRSLVPVNGCSLKVQEKGFLLTAPTPDRSLVQTAAAYRPPFVVRLRAKTYSSNVRLYYGAGMVIFNWEVRPTELRVYDPATNHLTAVRDQGYIEPNQWHDIAWEVRPDGMKVSVDGRERFAGAGDYAGLEAAVGLGPAFGSILNVESFTVEPE